MRSISRKIRRTLEERLVALLETIFIPSYSPAGDVYVVVNPELDVERDVESEDLKKFLRGLPKRKIIKIGRDAIPSPFIDGGVLKSLLMRELGISQELNERRILDCLKGLIDSRSFYPKGQMIGLDRKNEEFSCCPLRASVWNNAKRYGEEFFYWDQVWREKWKDTKITSKDVVEKGLKIAEIEEIGDVLGVDERGVQALVYFLVASRARILNPGMSVPKTLMLIGKQGTGKSRLTKEFGYVERHETASLSDMYNLKEYVGIARHRMVIEIADDSIVDVRAMNRFKSYTTRERVAWRQPYDRGQTTTIRQDVTIITTNRRDIEFDESGYRRFLPVVMDVVFGDSEEKMGVVRRWVAHTDAMVLCAAKNGCEWLEERQVWVPIALEGDKWKESKMVGGMWKSGMLQTEIDEVVEAILEECAGLGELVEMAQKGRMSVYLRGGAAFHRWIVGRLKGGYNMRDVGKKEVKVAMGQMGFAWVQKSEGFVYFFDGLERGSLQVSREYKWREIEGG